MSRLSSFFVIGFILALLGYVFYPYIELKGNQKPVVEEYDSIPLLKFVNDTIEINDTLLERKDRENQKREEEYKKKLKKLFDYSLTVDTLYNRLKNELEYCKKNNFLEMLFNEFNTGLNHMSRSQKEYFQLQKKWVKDALNEKDEKIQEFYSTYSRVFNYSDNYYHLNVMDTELRPGESLNIRGYKRYSWKSRSIFSSIKLNILKLNLDSKFKPTGYGTIYEGNIKTKAGEFNFNYKLNEAGIYKITASNNYCFKQYWVHVSWLDGVVKVDNEKLLVYISSFRDTIAPPYRVHIISKKGDLFTSNTNNEGLLVLRHNLYSERNDNSPMIAVEKDNQMAFLTGDLPNMRPDTVHVNYLYTDCPIYRPGKVVHFNGVIKMFQNGVPIERRYIDSVEVVINGPQRTELYKKVLTVDKWGHYRDSVLLDETQKQGAYYFTINPKQGKSQERCHFYRSYHQTPQFIVEAYKKPEFRLNVTTDKKKYTHGNIVNLNIKGEYFFGGPLASSEVKVRWYRQQMRYYGGFGRGVKGVHFYPYGTKRLIKEERFTLDEMGELDIQQKAFSNSNHEYLIAEVIVVDKSRREIREEIKVSISKFNTFLNMQLDKWRYEKNETVNCHLSAITIDGQPAKGIVKVVVRNYQKIIKDTSVILNDSGEATFKYKATTTGFFRFIAEIKDEKNKTIKTESRIRVTDYNSSVNRWDYTSINFDKSVYNTGDTAIVKVKAGSDSINALCTVEGDKIFNYAIKKLTNNSFEFKIPITNNMGGLLIFAISYSGENGMVMKSESAKIRDKNLLLNVNIEGSKNLEPGETFKGIITVKDYKGSSVKSNFSIALVDESLFSMAKRVNADMGYYYKNENKDTTSDIFNKFPQYIINRVYGGKQKFKSDFISVLKGGYLENISDLKMINQIISTVDLAIVAGNSNQPNRSVDIFGEGGFASGIDAVLSGLSGINMGAPVPRKKGAAGIGYGAGIGSGFGGGSGGVDDLIGSLMGDDGRSRELKMIADPPRERNEFKDVAYWAASCSTNIFGRAKVEFKMPDDLTQWRLVLIGSDGKIRYIEHRDTIVTKKNVMIKLEAPRSMVEDDSLVITSVVHNYADTTLNASVSLNIKRGEAKLYDESDKTIIIESGETERIDWPVKVLGTDSVEFYTSIISERGSDAESRLYPVNIKGIVQHKSSSGVIGNKTNKANISIVYPKNINQKSYKVNLHCTPTLVGSMFESLEYLTGFPYGCVEQTMSRFLPNLYVQKIMKKMSVENDSLMKMMPKYTHDGIMRLEQLQNKDGSWGWWKGDRGDARLTSMVVYGLRYALDSQIEDKDRLKLKDILKAGEASAIKILVSTKTSNDNKASLINSLYQNKQYETIIKEEIKTLYPQKENLSTGSLAKLLEVTHNYNMKSEKNGLLKIVLSRVKKFGDAVYWEGSSKYRWYKQDEETTAEVLKVLVSVIPKDDIIPQVVRWLARQKNKGYWVSTKTTAKVVEAISCHLMGSDELEPNYTVEVFLDGEKLYKTGKINKKNISNSDLELKIDPDNFKDSNSIEIVIKGNGKLYYTLHQEFMTAGDNINKNDNGISIKRSYTELKYIKNKKGEWDIVRKPFDGILKSGEELEVTLKIKTDNGGEFMMVEDFFPSGMEYLKKPESWYNRWCYYWFSGYTHKEARDDRIVFFMSQANTEQTFSYLLRAETPGKYTALPAKGEFMYEPEICGNSEGTVLTIVDDLEK